MSLDFYDRLGRPRIYTDDGENLFSWAGIPVAYIKEAHIYLFSGEHYGRLREGWILDNRGRRVLFSRDATGGPLKPLKKLKPLKNLKRLKPLKKLRKLPPLAPLPKNAWIDSPW